MLLPSQFWVPHGDPLWKGGVERALMSTTADKAVALHYANGKGTIVEIDVGRIQIGGDVSFLSMVRPLLRHPWHPCPTCVLSTVLPMQPPMQLLATRSRRVPHVGGAVSG